MSLKSVSVAYNFHKSLHYGVNFKGLKITLKWCIYLMAFTLKKNHWLTREDPQSISIQSAGLRKKLIRKHLVFPLERSCQSLNTRLNECVRQQKQTNRADKAAKDVLVTSPSFYITQWINMPVVAARNDNAVIRDTISLLFKNCKLLVSRRNLFFRFPALKMVFYLLWEQTGD